MNVNDEFRPMDTDNFKRIDGEIRSAPFSLFRPSDWNGDLVLLVHGSLPEIFEGLAHGLMTEGFGIGFATYTGGEGKALKTITLNTQIVQDRFTSDFEKPDRTYLYGFSRGAATVTKLVETAPVRYDGVLTVCGGNGGSQLAWEHFFTARVLFDYYFPGVLPGDALHVPNPPHYMEEFEAEVAPEIAAAIAADPAAAREMAAVDQYHLEYEDFDELAKGIVQSLAVHTFGVNDLLAAAGGNPFDNRAIVYTGTADDDALNAGVARLRADPQATAYLNAWYEPNGTIDGTPILVVHTTRDPMVPEQLHNDKYQALVERTGNGPFFVRRRVDRFGHCTFTPGELADHFTDLVTWAENGVRPGS